MGYTEVLETFAFVLLISLLWQTWRNMRLRKYSLEEILFKPISEFEDMLTAAKRKELKFQTNKNVNKNSRLCKEAQAAKNRVFKQLEEMHIDAKLTTTAYIVSPNLKGAIEQHLLNDRYTHEEIVKEVFHAYWSYLFVSKDDV